MTTPFARNRVVPAILALSFLVLITASNHAEEIDDDSISTPATRELDLKFINAELELAKANLDFVLEKNRQRAGSYSLIFVEELKLRIKLYEVWSAELMSENPQVIPIDIQKAKGELTIAEMRLREAETLKKIKPRSISEGQMKRLRLSVAAAQAWVEKVSHPSYEKQPRDERIQWRFVILGKGQLEMRLAGQR